MKNWFSKLKYCFNRNSILTEQEKDILSMNIIQFEKMFDCYSLEWNCNFLGVYFTDTKYDFHIFKGTKNKFQEKFIINGNVYKLRCVYNLSQNFKEQTQKFLK